MKDYIYLSTTTPHDETCIGISDNDYRKDARFEANAYIRQLVRTLGKPPEGSDFKVVYCPHDFGTYLDIIFMYNDEQASHFDYMNRAERGCEKWDVVALRELKLNGYQRDKFPADESGGSRKFYVGQWQNGSWC